MRHAPRVRQARLDTFTPQFIESYSLAASAIAVFKGMLGAHLVMRWRGAGCVLLTSCECSEGWTLEARPRPSCSLLSQRSPMVPAPASQHRLPVLSSLQFDRGLFCLAL